MLMVVNMYRPLTRNAKSTIEVMREIEQAADISFTGIVNNSNLGVQTTLENVLSAQEKAGELAEKTGLALLTTCVKQDLASEAAKHIRNITPVTLHFRVDWAIF